MRATKQPQAYINEASNVVVKLIRKKYDPNEIAMIAVAMAVHLQQTLRRHQS
jgi:hypothetical protein